MIFVMIEVSVDSFAASRRSDVAAADDDDLAGKLDIFAQALSSCARST